MPEKDDVTADRFYAEVPVAHQTYALKGSGAYDWGMANRLARIFQPADGRTVMLAIDHGIRHVLRDAGSQYASGQH